MTCANCLAEIPPWARICSECGAGVVPAGAHPRDPLTAARGVLAITGALAVAALSTYVFVYPWVGLGVGIVSALSDPAGSAVGSIVWGTVMQTYLVTLLGLLSGVLILAARQRRVAALASGVLVACSLETFLLYFPAFLLALTAGAPAEFESTVFLEGLAGLLGGGLMAAAGLLALWRQRRPATMR